MITDVGGVTVGHWTDTDAATGCTVILLPEGTVGAVTLPGAAPATRETDLLRPENLVSEVHAFVLTGGSAFGLAAADGVVGALADRGVGFEFGGVRVPIVPAAAIFDLGIGDGSVRPDGAAGRAALEAAAVEVAEGSVGAGAGATCGKWAGPELAVKGGLGTASAVIQDTGCRVGAIMVVNPGGDVLDERGEVLAGARTDAPPAWSALAGRATVIGAVVTDARLDKSSATHVARMAAVGIGRAVCPAHTPFDGDVLFCGATGKVEAEPVLVGALGAEVVAEAIRRGVRKAHGLHGVPGLADG